MCSTFRSILLLASLTMLCSHAFAQKSESIAPPPDSATIEEVQKWLAGALVKYGSYKTRVSVVDLSNVAFEACTLKFTITRKSGSTSTAVMGATRTVNKATSQVAIEGLMMTPERIQLSENVYPELQTIQIGLKTGDPTVPADDRVVELVVKSEAAKAIRSALIQSSRNCASTK